MPQMKEQFQSSKLKALMPQTYKLEHKDFCKFSRTAVTLWNICYNIFSFMLSCELCFYNVKYKIQTCT